MIIALVLWGWIIEMALIALTLWWMQRPPPDQPPSTVWQDASALFIQHCRQEVG